MRKKSAILLRVHEAEQNGRHGTESSKKGEAYMKHIGVLVAVEVESVVEAYKEDLVMEKTGGFDVYTLRKEEFELHFVHSGAGLIRAAAAVELLCHHFSVDMMVNFGVVGALTADLAVMDTCFVEKVVHYDMDTSEIDGCEVGRYIEYPDIYLRTNEELLACARDLYPDIPVVTAACADKFVGKAEDKSRLHTVFGADICDMESAAVVLVCDLNRVPCLLIKTISDSLTGGPEEFSNRVREAGDRCIRIVEHVVHEKLA